MPSMTNRKILNTRGLTAFEALILLTILTLMAVFLYTQFYWIDQRVNNRRCADNLRRIWTGIQIYANGNPSRELPSDSSADEALGRLFVRGNLTRLEVFDCPFRHGHPRGFPGPDLTHPGGSLRGTEYLYTRSRLTLDSPGESPVVSDIPGSHSGGRVHVLHLDGTVTEESEIPAGF